MNLQQIINHLDLNVLTESRNFSEITPTTGYTSDLLSCVMAGANSGSLWVTLQAHTNIVAVAALLEMSAIIITEGAQPNSTTIEKANSQSIILLSTKLPSFEIVGRLWDLGVRSSELKLSSGDDSQLPG